MPYRWTSADVIRKIKWLACRHFGKKVRISSTKGTYIRAFARDLGEALDSGAFLSYLIRSRSGDYPLSQALTMAQVSTLFQD